MPVLTDLFSVEKKLNKRKPRYSQTLCFLENVTNVRGNMRVNFEGCVLIMELKSAKPSFSA